MADGGLRSARAREGKNRAASAASSVASVPDRVRQEAAGGISGVQTASSKGGGLPARMAIAWSMKAGA